MENLEREIFLVRSEKDFESLALKIFRFQSQENPVYKAYLEHLNVDPAGVFSLPQIPLLPIELFKEHRIISGTQEAKIVFESSGTSGQQTSKHHVVSELLYQQSFLRTFKEQVGDPENLCILALLPSYLERNNASLVYMMQHLIERSNHPDSGFYLDNLDKLTGVLLQRNDDRHPSLLLGVSFALLDLAEQFPIKLEDNITLMETGGMKGRRKEFIRDELHDLLNSAFGFQHVRSEYGMTELLSQAYTTPNGNFLPARWMKVFARDMYDPASILPAGQRGAINIIDLANLYSCSFLESADLGMVHQDGSFEIHGRMDQSEIRGCNLMVY